MSVDRGSERVPFEVEIDVESLIRRFFACESLSPVEITSTREAFSLDANEVVDLFPIPFSRALNFRFVAFMVGMIFNG